MAKILVAIPDGDQRELYRFALRFAGHHVFTYGGLGEAIGMAGKSPPEVIVLDAQLLGMLEKEDQILAQQELSRLEIPVIYILDQETSSETRALLSLILADSISRPFSPDQLTRWIHRFLRQKRAG